MKDSRAQSSSAPLVSVVLPVFGADPEHLRQALRSLQQQKWRDFEVIVVEDPSPVPVSPLLEELRDERFIHIRNSTRTGLPRQHNTGLKRARGLVICRFDSDDICEPEKLQLQVDFLENHPEIDVLGTNLRIIDQSGRTIGARTYPEDHEAIMATFPRTNPIANPTVMFRREIFERFGGWDEDSVDPAQDYEWFSRVARGGATFSNLQQPLVRYRIHPGAIKRRHLRGTLRTTIKVKEKYWTKDLGVRGHAVLRAEKMLLLFPSALVYRLFLFARYRSGS